jgi:hypothetical protein
LNGIPLETIRHSGRHDNYSTLVRNKLGDMNLNSSTFLADFENLVLDIEEAIRNNPSVHINQLSF